MHESTDPNLVDEWRIEPVRCFVCEARASEVARFRDQGGSTDGLLLRTHRSGEEVNPE